jgi:hypothetical protein
MNFVLYPGMGQRLKLKRLIICVVLALVLGLILSANAYAQTRSQQSAVPVRNPSQNLATTATAPNKASEIEGFWRIQLSQKQFQDPFNQRQLTEFRLLTDLRYAPLKEAYFSLAPKFTYTTGFAQTLEGTNASKAEWGVREASIRSDLSFVHLGLGALDQTLTHPSSLLADQTFPAAMIRLHSALEDNWVYALEAESGIPTTSSLSTQAREFEKTPGFASGSLSIKAQKMMVDLNLRAGVYQFQNLPMSVASKSSLIGNTTVSGNGTDSEFVYEYQGAFAEMVTKVHLARRFSIGAELEYVQNDQAPSSLNQGSSAKLFSAFHLTKNLEISPFYSYFRVEPDAAVALYNSDLIGTNRVGYIGGVSGTYKQTLRLTISGGERDVIFNNPFQKREKILTLKLETFDVSI